MKRFFLIITLLLSVFFIFSVSDVFAQYAYFGIKGGLNFSSFHGDQSEARFWGADKKESRMSFFYYSISEGFCNTTGVAFFNERKQICHNIHRW